MTDQLQNKAVNRNPAKVEPTLEELIITVQHPRKPENMDAIADSSLLPVGKESEMTDQLPNMAIFTGPSIDEPPLQESMTVHNVETSENMDTEIFEQPFTVTETERKRIDTHAPKNILPSLDATPESAAEQSVETNQMHNNAVKEEDNPNQPLEATITSNKRKKRVSFEHDVFQIPDSVGTLEPSASEILSKVEEKKNLRGGNCFLNRATGEYNKSNETRPI